MAATPREGDAVGGDDGGAARVALELRCIQVLRAWKDGGYKGRVLNDATGAKGVTLRELPPEATGFAVWTRCTGSPATYGDPDGTPRGVATLAEPSTKSGFARADRVPVAILYLHGGGYRKYKPTDSYVLAISTRLAAACAAPVLTIDYRLAPEFRAASRAAVHDVCDGLRWLAAQYVGADVFVAGDSAGAGLALASAMCIMQGDVADAPGVPAPSLPSGLCLLSPYIDLTLQSPSFVEAMFRHEDGWGDLFYTNQDGLSDAESDRAWLWNRAKDYVADMPPDDPLCSPALAPDDLLRRLPPLLAMVGGHEVFLHETRRLAARAQRVGVDVHLVVWPRMWHDWFNYCDLPGKLPEPPPVGCQPAPGGSEGAENAGVADATAEAEEVGAGSGSTDVDGPRPPPAAEAPRLQSAVEAYAEIAAWVRGCVERRAPAAVGGESRPADGGPGS